MSKIKEESEILFESLRIKAIAKENNVKFTKEDLKKQVKLFTGKTENIFDTINDKERTIEERRNTELKAINYYRDLSININYFYFIDKERKSLRKQMIKKGYQGDLSSFIKAYPYLSNNTELYVLHEDSKINKNTIELFLKRFAKEQKSEKAMEAVDYFFEFSPEAYLSILKYKEIFLLKSFLKELSKSKNKEETKERIKNSSLFKTIKITVAYNRKEIDTASAIKEIEKIL